ncbi:sucrase ferredoxin [Ktedonosporobacter rubrisoli]|nr:sucrase ferredoxin [Ktedonosporobacter rubrisoli]
MAEKPLCACVSQDAHVPMIGTAPNVDLWLLLEYTGPWNADAPEKSALSSRAKEWLEKAQQFYPRTRLQFIRHHTRPIESITFYIALSQESRQALYAFRLSDYDELLDIDLFSLMSGHTYYDKYLSQETLFLVCTHGKHDRCCAKFGLPIYGELRNFVGECTWQTSHLGGDQFAATVLCLPAGVYYGRVTQTDIEPIVQYSRQQQIYIEKYRGRTCYTPAVQVADYFLRRCLAMQAIQIPTIRASSSPIQLAQPRSKLTFLEEPAIRNLDIFRLLAAEDKTTGCWDVCFESQHDQNIHQLRISEQLHEVTSYSICKGEQTSCIKSYHLKKYHALEAIALGAS